MEETEKEDNLSHEEALKQIEEQKNKSLGKYKLGKKLDDVNIRDFAHN